MGIPVFEIRDPLDLDSLAWFSQLQQGTSLNSEAAGVVAQIISDVQAQADQAVVRYMQQWTDPGFCVEQIRVSADALDQSLKNLNQPIRQALQRAIRHVRAYQQHIKPVDPKPLKLDGAELGLRFTPVSRVGLLVPGGKAAYPSTVIMLAVPALVAGVDPDSISVVTPPPTRQADQAPQDVSPLVLAACAMLGIKRVYRIGGAQAVAALALGTPTVHPVDMIAGPGNVYTQLAKIQLQGSVGIDGFYGPSEVLTIADESANPDLVAADLIAQAEHDPGRCFLVAWSQAVIDRVNKHIQEQLIQRRRRGAVEDSFSQWSAAILAPDEDVAVKIADRIAAEHVNLAVESPNAWLNKLHHGGEYFLGDQTPIAVGDYLAGPSHCLPTGTTARYTSGVSVYTFLKRSGTISYPQGLPADVIDAVAVLAKAEGLDGHAASVEWRRSTSE